jgi:hypothetical protein
MVTQMTSHIFIFNVIKQLLDLLSNTNNKFCDLYLFHVTVVAVNFTQNVKKHNRDIAHITHILAKLMQH